MNELIRILERERKNVGYDDDTKEEPNIFDETVADFYETKAEAWFAGWDECLDKVIEILRAHATKV